MLIQCHRKGPVYDPLVLSGKKKERKKSNFLRNEMEELLLENSKWAVKGPSLHWCEGGTNTELGGLFPSCAAI